MVRPSTLSLGTVLELTGGSLLLVGGFTALATALAQTDATVGFILFVGGVVGVLAGWLPLARGAVAVVAAGVHRAEREDSRDGGASAAGAAADD